MRGATYLSQGEARTRRQQFPRNTDEDLDPTFKSKKTEPPAEVFASCSQGLPSHTLFQLIASLIIRPAFISPTKRQPEKLGHQKSRDKKEGCKQQ
ncbi:unnamed protein product [Lepidochelys olivacea]